MDENGGRNGKVWREGDLSAAHGGNHVHTAQGKAGGVLGGRLI